MRTNKVLYRNTKNGKIAGVCSGLAEYMDVDVSLIRIVWLFFVIFGGAGLLLYLIAALVIPAKSGDDVEIIVEDEEQKRLTRDSENAVIFGVCSGIAKHFGMDVSVVRIIFLLMGLYFASGIFLYIILALVLPKN
ncbi:MAG TPA: PspC domain-containing protein [Candidatus Cloacimonetes bacterium]|nr:PspC domain-containing protein [Candidatus Cloacimonadota bacterium]